MAKTKQKKQTQTPACASAQLPRGRLAALGAAAGLGFFQPLFLKTGYLDLVSAKVAWVLVLALLCAGMMLCFLLSKKGRAALRRPGSEALWLLGFAAVYTASAATSQYGTEPWLGAMYRYNGAALYICLTVIYCFVRGWGGAALPRVSADCIQLAAALAGIVSCANYCSMDVLGVFADIGADVALIMTSTLGNLNFAAVFYLIGGLLALCDLLQQPEGRRRQFHLGCWCVISAALVCCASDGSFIALAAALCVILCQKGLTWQKLRCLIGAAAVTTGAGFVIGMIKLLRKSKFFLSFPYRLLVNPPVAAVLCIGLVLLYRLLARPEAARPAQDLSSWARRICAAIGAVLVILLAAIHLAPDAFPQALTARLAFGPSWGSNRGYVWGLTPTLWGMLSPREKLLGAGPDMVVYLLNPMFTQRMIELNGAPFDSMHNEYLQYLLCGGILGLAAWIGVLGSHLRAAWKAQTPLNHAFGLALGAYALQAVFNLATPATTPVLYLVLACCGASKGEGEPTPDWKQWVLAAVLTAMVIWPGAAWLAS